MLGETISPEGAARFVKSGIWLDYGATHCEPDVFVKALAARKDELEKNSVKLARIKFARTPYNRLSLFSCTFLSPNCGCFEENGVSHRRLLQQLPLGHV